MSDVITMAYVYKMAQDQDDFGTADLDDPHEPSKFLSRDELDALRYSLANLPSFKLPLYGADYSPERPVVKQEKVCTCGTHKTYGTKASMQMHSSWCDLRN